MKTPNYLKQSKQDLVYQPALLRLNSLKDRNIIQRLKKRGDIHTIVDEYESQLEELFKIENPAVSFQPSYPTQWQNHLKEVHKVAPLWQQGVWVYYPWLKTLTHILEHDQYLKVRTARNRNLITEKEQHTFYNAVVGIAGQSVGSSVVLALVLEGGARHLKIADFDNLELSNTNRIHAPISSLGLPKVIITARKVYEVNPYAQVDIYDDGLHEKNVLKFFTDGAKLDVMVDEVDNMAVKLLIRETAKKLKVPVVMATDNGENGLVDIERYDKRPAPQAFHGRLGNVTRDRLSRLTKIEIGRMAGQFVGIENIPPRMIESLREVGHTLASWPQLGGAALLNGVAVAYVIRRITNNQSITDNRGYLQIDEALNPELKTKEGKAHAKKVRHAFMKAMSGPRQS